MTTRLEYNERIFQCLYALAGGYKTGDFSSFFPYLSQDCVFESQWVITPNAGYEAVTKYLMCKGRTLKKSGCFPRCSLVELVGNINEVKNAQLYVNGKAADGSLGLLYTPGKLCLHMEQTTNEKTYGIIVDLSLDDNGLVKRVDLCMPELFNYRSFYNYVDFMPATDDSENSDALIRISESYYCELALFLGAVGVEYDEYDDLHIPTAKWNGALQKWKYFLEEKSFDEVYEHFSGIDYSDWSATDSHALRLLGRGGQQMWAERPINGLMLEGLLEWTQMYAGDYSFVNTSGF